MRRLCMVALATLVASCGQTDNAPGEGAAGGDAAVDSAAGGDIGGGGQGGDGEGPADTVVGDGVAGDGVAGDGLAGDSGAVDTGDPGNCPGGTGCACAANDDCDAAFCIETIHGKQCAATCTDTCPGGYACTNVGVGGDAVALCLPKFGMYCRPCNDDSVCQVAGASDAACVRHGLDGGYCGAACTDDADCPANSACVEVERVGGGKTQQCVQGGAKSAPSCACGAAAKAEGWFTDCTAPGEAAGLLCPGARTCGASGLSSCVKKAGVPCVDTQCLVDQKPGGAPVKAGTVCSDGLDCTVGDVCDDKGACVPGVDTCPCKTAADCADDQDLCNGQPFCDLSATPPVCKTNPATVVSCATGKDSACKKNTCQPGSGQCELTTLPDASACDDGDPCTSGDACVKGACVGTVTCKCKSQADCAGFEDGDACNGTLYCDLAAGSCKLNPATVVSCPTVDDSACQKNLCDAKTGQCSMTPAAPGPCDDGNACTQGDACKGGSCAPGKNLCSCASDADCAGKNGGNACLGTLFCDKNVGVCVVDPSTVKVCPKGKDTACTKSLCDPATGACKATPVAEGKGCDDGDVCTKQESCKSGVCASQTNACTCKVTADCAGYEDGDWCNGTLYCDQTAGVCKVNPATVVSCPSAGESACKVNACKHSFGAGGQATGASCQLVPRPNGLACADDNPCTEGDVCIDGACSPGTKVCECKTDAMCQPKGGVDKCAGKHVCKAGVCKQEGGKQCPTDQDTVCLSNQCQPVDGACAMTATNDDKPCDDNDACSTSSACKGGKCVATKQLSCDDGNACTADACDPKGGCTYTAASGACDDGKACTEAVCEAKTCKTVDKPEVCDGGKLDEDCDGQTDEEGAQGCTQWYLDGDGDKAPSKASKCLCGASGKYTVALAKPPSASQLDCADNDGSRYPGAQETCDNVDHNCDGHQWLASAGALSEGLPGSVWYYLDGDNDGYANTSKKKKLCAATGSYTLSKATAHDCHDGDKAIYPGAAETCDSTDVNCDGHPLVKATGYASFGLKGCLQRKYDGDGDGWGDKWKSGQCVCTAYSKLKVGGGHGYTTSLGHDCNDSNASAKPLQTAYFSYPHKSGSLGYDWNCDSKVEKRYVDTANCPGKSSSSAKCESWRVKGFKKGAIGCGVLGEFLSECKQKSGVGKTCVAKTWTSFKQTCR